MKRLLLILFLLIPTSLFGVTIRFAWDKPVTTWTGTITYNFYRGIKADASDVVKLNATAITVENYADSTAVAGQIYYYTVRAVYGTLPNSESANSNILKVDLTVLPQPPPNLRVDLLILP